VSGKFQASVSHRDDVAYVKLAGVIDEDNELAALVDQVRARSAVIDLGEIERINSCGVRDWVNWLSRVEQSASVILVECSPPIVAQINLVNNFTGQGVVRSFYVPYFCPECEEEKVLLVEAADMKAAPHDPPICRCDECDLVMDFDEMPELYFAFLANPRKIAAPGGVAIESRSGRVRTRVVSFTSGSSLVGVSSLGAPSQGGFLATPSSTGGSRGSFTPGGSPRESSSVSHPPTSDGGQVARADGRAGTSVYVMLAVVAVAVAVAGFLLLR
jgi:anti-anti-sigma regulatory factor